LVAHDGGLAGLNLRVGSYGRERVISINSSSKHKEIRGGDDPMPALIGCAGAEMLVVDRKLHYFTRSASFLGLVPGPRLSSMYA